MDSLILSVAALGLCLGPAAVYWFSRADEGKSGTARKRVLLGGSLVLFNLVLVGLLVLQLLMR